MQHPTNNIEKHNADNSVVRYTVIINENITESLEPFEDIEVEVIRPPQRTKVFDTILLIASGATFGVMLYGFFGLFLEKFIKLDFSYFEKTFMLLQYIVPGICGFLIPFIMELLRKRSNKRNPYIQREIIHARRVKVDLDGSRPHTT